jgi:hypothetical protein
MTTFLPSVVRDDDFHVAAFSFRLQRKCFHRIQPLGGGRVFGSNECLGCLKWQTQLGYGVAP